MMSFLSNRSCSRLLLLPILFALALVCLVPLPPAYADDPDGIDILVTSDGSEFQATAEDTNRSAAFQGTGARENVNPNLRPRNAAPLSVKSGAESVIIPDERRQVTNTAKFPNSAVAYLLITFPAGQSACTGYFIGPDTLATAGHCVYDSFAGGFAKKIKVYPGRNGNSLPYGQAKSIQLFTNKCWRETEDPTCDYGGIKINKPLGNQTGWFGLAVSASDSQLLNKKASVIGYPYDKSPGTLWTMKGPIQVVTPKQVGYPMDTAAGQSGSPIFNNTICKKCAVGIHAYGFFQGDPQPPFGERNSGTRITQKVYNVLCRWRGGC